MIYLFQKTKCSFPNIYPQGTDEDLVESGGMCNQIIRQVQSVQAGLESPTDSFSVTANGGFTRYVLSTLAVCEDT